MLRRDFFKFVAALPIVGAFSPSLGRQWKEGDNCKHIWKDGRSCHCVLVLNRSGVTLKPCRVVSYPNFKYCNNFRDAPAGVTVCHRDGVKNGHLFWLAIRGFVPIAIHRKLEVSHSQ